ncbi:MAG: glycosyltransferase family 4 protein [Bacteroidaceae bacterium]|nr:glycosyltransferase family 4 protein [Bacteroidaceae bacterium]
MKILFILPGAGDSFYCGNCFRDNLQALALRKAGHEIIIMPLYLPLKHHTFQGDTPLFFPATTYYVEQKMFGKHKMPSWMKRVLGSEALLDMASSLSGTTSAEGMEDMTLSMIEGEGHAFDENVKQLVDWVKQNEKPDVIQLSTSLLLGIAKELKKETGIPIVCSLQDEEVWIDSLKSGFVEKAWKGVLDNTKYVDRFITTSYYYQQIVNAKLPQLGRVEVIYPGIDLAKYQSDDYPVDPTIGFFYRMNELDGLDILADAFVILKKRGSIPHLKLRIGGGYMSPDKKLVKQVKRTLKPYATDVVIEETYAMENHADFYRKITLLSVPLRFQEGVGLYLCEAFAAGRPAVEPNTGSFSEIVGQAGLTYSPYDARHLADALEEMLTDKQLYNRCREHALALARERYDDMVWAKRLTELYGELHHCHT